MTKQSLFTMKLEPDLHAAFMAEAEASHRPASQVVRELMRDFVVKQQESRAYEAFLRQKVDSARASIAAGKGISSKDVEAIMAEKRRQALG